MKIKSQKDFVTLFGEEFIKRDLEDAARNTLLPVAKGAFDTPEQPAAAALLPKERAREPGG